MKTVRAPVHVETGLHAESGMYNIYMPPIDQTPSPAPIHEQKSTPAKPAGPTVGIVIILIVIIFGALYFWGDVLNRSQQQEQLPFIPGDSAEQ